VESEKKEINWEIDEPNDKRRKNENRKKENNQYD